MSEARRASIDVAGIDDLVSRSGALNEVDINPVNPDITTDGWTLSVADGFRERRG